jgi:DHA3 family tetracycline resistance protein-like MFS transporter
VEDDVAVGVSRGSEPNDAIAQEAGAEPAGAARPGMLAALRRRDFGLLWAGQTVSSLGDGIFTVALVIETLRIDPRPVALAYVLVARTVPEVCFGLLGGVTADRVPKRLAMLSADIARCVAVTVIAILVVAHADSLAALLVMSVTFGIADAFFGPASMAFVPEVLPPELLVQGNALNSTSSNLATSLVGPATGGAIVGFIGIAGSFVADAVSFGVSIVTLSLISVRSRPAPSGKTRLEEAREGLAYIRSRKWLLGNLIAASLANLFGIAPLSVLLALLLRHELHVSAFTLGLVFAAGGAAGVVASLVVAHLGAPRHRIVVMWIAYGLSGAAIAAMAFAPNAIVVGVLSALEIGLIVYGDVLYVAMMQEMVPQELRGRVFSTAFLIAFVLLPVGTVLGGVAASIVGTRTAIFWSGMLAGLCALIVLFPSMRPVVGPTGAEAP